MGRAVTSFPRKGDEFLYTYAGSLFKAPHPPKWVPDELRSRPTLVVGSNGSGKSELMVAQAFQDACKGRPVWFFDAKADRNALNKIHYWCHLVAGRPFLALLPSAEMDHLSHTWNPFLSTNQSIDTVAEIFFNSYRPPVTSGRDAAVDFYTADQRRAVTNLLKALYHSGLAYSIKDVRYILEYPEVMDWVGNLVKDEGRHFYGELIRQAKNDRDFRKNIRGFLNYLQPFDAFSINSYNPQVDFERLYYTDAVVYIGLPVNLQPQVMGCVGNLILNQMMSMAAWVQTNERRHRRAVSLIIDETQAFVKENLGDVVCRIRSSGFLLTLGFQTVDSMERIGPAFKSEITVNTPNVYMFSPRCSKTAKWFSELSGMKRTREYSLHIEESEDEAKEVGTGTVRAGERPTIPIDSILQLGLGQCFLESEGLENPIKIQAACLYDPPPQPAYEYRRIPYLTAPERGGLNLAPMITRIRRDLGDAFAS